MNIVETSPGDAMRAGHLPIEGTCSSDNSCPFMPVFSPPKVMFVRGEGSTLWDEFGREYIDLLAGIAVVGLGHSHPVIAAALADQARELIHVSNFFANPTATEAARMLNTMLKEATGAIGQVFFSNSGAESVEAAIKLARRHGGSSRSRIVCAKGSFHGRTLGALSATGQPLKQEPFQPLVPGFSHVAYGDLDALEAALDDDVCAVLLESIQGEAGVVVPPAGYLIGVQEACRRRDVLLMIDEVQTGLGRTGRWFGFEHAGLAPDVVTLAKALGNGFPVAATWARADVAASFQPGDHGSTFSGSSLAGAVVVAVLEQLHQIDAPQRALTVGSAIRRALEDVPGIAGIEGEGLLLGVQLKDGLDARTIAATLLDRGVVVNAVSAQRLRLAPPLTISEDLVTTAVGKIAESLSEAVDGHT